MSDKGGRSEPEREWEKKNGGKWIVRTLPTIVRIVGDGRSSKWGYMSCQEVSHEQQNGKRKGASGNESGRTAIEEAHGQVMTVGWCCEEKERGRGRELDTHLNIMMKSALRMHCEARTEMT